MSTFKEYYLDRVNSFMAVAKEEYAKIFPIDFSNLRVEASNINIETPNLENIHTFQNAKLSSSTMTGDVFADIKIFVDGKQKSSKNHVRIGRIPLFTPRGTFILDGNEYTLPTQLRLGYGTFVHKSQAGEVVTQVNVERGMGFKILFDPEKLIFQIQAGGRLIGLLPFLNALGVENDAIRKSWGASIYDSNMRKYPPRTHLREVESANEIFVGKSSQDPHTLKETVTKFTMDPEINRAALGVSDSTVTGRLLLSASARMIDVNRGKAESVDRDSLAFKKVIDMNGYLRERISGGAANIRSKVISKLRRYGHDIDKVFEYDVATGPVMAMLRNYTQVTFSDQANPNAWMGDRKKVSIMGTGGIQDMRQITNKAISINPSSFGFIDPTFTPEGDRLGAVNRMTATTVVRDGKFHTIAYDVSAKKNTYVDHVTLANSTWSPADEYNFNEKTKVFTPKHQYVNGYRNAKEAKLKPSEVNYILYRDNFFNEVTWSIPFINSNQGNRAALAAKIIIQSIPLKNREPKLVQARKSTNNDTYDEIIVKESPDVIVESPVAGTVKEIKNDAIVIADQHGKRHSVSLYNHFPLNGEAFINHEPVVGVGDKVKVGQLLADSNHTRNGQLATGVNLRTAYMTHKGNTLDDGIVISESASSKLTSVHLYKFEVEFDEEDKRAKRFYVTQFPGKIQPASAAKIGENGVIAEGSPVEPGDYLAIKLKRKDVGYGDDLKKIQRSLVSPWIDLSVKWEEDVPGKVVRVIDSGNKVQIHVSAEEPAMVGDKLSNSHAAKGTISAIVNDDDMPKLKDGSSIDIILSPNALPSRMNTGQLLELAAAKLAEKMGKTYVVDQFSGESNAKKLLDEMKKAGVDPKDEVTLQNGRKVNVFTGKEYILKLEHQASKKSKARYLGPYSALLVPTKSGDKPAGESMDPLTMYSLMGHNAVANLKDSVYKGQKNVDFWNAVELGLPLPKVKQPYTFKKMVDYMRAAGVNVNEYNGLLSIMPTTDKAIARLSAGEIKSPDQVYGKNLKPIEGGLYDPTITGGLHGDRYAHIELGTKIPNPIVVGNLAAVLGIKSADLEDIAREKLWINPKTKELKALRKPQEGFSTGWDAMKKMISEIDVTQRLDQVERDIKTETNATKLNNLLRQARLLRMLKSADMDLQDLFISKMLVLPPAARPIYATETGEVSKSEINSFYKNVLLSSKKYGELKELGVPDDDPTMKRLRATIYDEYKNYQGLTAPAENEPMGLLRALRGRDEAKEGFFWGKVVRKKQDLSGHAVLGPDINLNIDHAVIPEEMAWVLYAPFIIRRLIKNGYNPLQARKQLQDRTESAKKAMLEEAKERPVLLNRNPSLHKFNIMGFYPEIKQIQQIKLNPLVNKMFNADHDGDTLSVYVPVTPEAVEEAKAITPANVMIHPARKTSLVSLYEDSVNGLYNASAPGKKKTGKKFVNFEEAKAAYDRNELDMTDIITIGSRESTYGRFAINDAIPEKYRNYDVQFTKRIMNEIMTRIAKENRPYFASTVRALQLLGTEFASDSGVTVGITDLIVPVEGRDRMVSDAQRRIKSPEDTDAMMKLVDESIKLTRDIGDDNNFVRMANSGSRGDINQVKQILVTPLFVNDTDGKPLPRPITKSYAEGLGISDYLATQYGVRLGSIGKKKEVSGPGYANKLLITATSDELVSMDDCGTQRGVDYSIEDPDAEGRYLAVKVDGYNRNTLVTPSMMSDLKKKRIGTITVRTPMRCKAPRGVCKKCAGLTEDGAEYNIGANIGVIASQSITEPLSQGSLNLFHSGGVLRKGKEAMSRVEELQSVINVPLPSMNDATLSMVDGKVTAIKERPGGGFDIMVGDAAHFSPPLQEVSVAVGDKVTKGDELTHGSVNFRSLHGIVDREKVQDKIVSEMGKIYENDNMDKKIFEIVAKVLTNHAVVNDSGSNTMYLKNDVVPLNMISYVNDAVSGKKELPLNMAIGWQLGKSYGDFDRGEDITPEVAGKLRMKGISKVIVDGTPMKVKPTIVGVKTIPLVSSDWTERILAEDMTENLVKSIVSGLTSETLAPPKQVVQYISGAFPDKPAK